jgi:hypothetical protein
VVEESTFPVHQKSNEDMEDVDEDDEVIIFLDEIIRYRMIPRRTNWRYRYLALNQQEVAAVSNIQLSISELTDFFLVLVLLVNQLLTVLHSSTRRNADQNVPLRQQMAPVIRFYSRLLAFCYPRLDNLILEEQELVGITRGEWEAAVAREADTPPRNRSIEALSEGDAHRLTLSVIVNGDRAIRVKRNIVPVRHLVAPKKKNEFTATYHHRRKGEGERRGDRRDGRHIQLQLPNLRGTRIERSTVLLLPVPPLYSTCSRIFLRGGPREEFQYNSWAARTL